MERRAEGAERRKKERSPWVCGFAGSGDPAYIELRALAGAALRFQIADSRLHGKKREELFVWIPGLADG